MDRDSKNVVLVNSKTPRETETKIWEKKYDEDDVTVLEWLRGKSWKDVVEVKAVAMGIEYTSKTEKDNIAREAYRWAVNHFRSKISKVADGKLFNTKDED